MSRKDNIDDDKNNNCIIIEGIGNKRNSNEDKDSNSSISIKEINNEQESHTNQSRRNENYLKLHFSKSSKDLRKELKETP